MPISKAAWEAAFTIDEAVQGFLEDQGFSRRTDREQRSITLIAQVIQDAIDKTIRERTPTDGC